jgi:RIO-like serine/threonine protein kinase
MQQVQLSEVEQRVYRAVSALEVRGDVPYPDVIAQEAGMTEEELREPLHLLTERGLLHREDSPAAGLDFGPRWCARQLT